MDLRTGWGRSGPTPEKGHAIETNRDGHQLRQFTNPQVGEPIGDAEFEILHMRFTDNAVLTPGGRRMAEHVPPRPTARETVDGAVPAGRTSCPHPEQPQ
jgi:hypothetical protein